MNLRNLDRVEPTDNSIEDGRMPMELSEALASLNCEDGAHWTKSGKPDLNVLKEMVGRTVRRSEDGGLTRTAARRVDDLQQSSDEDATTAADDRVMSSEVSLPATLNLNSAETLRQALIDAISGSGGAFVDGSRVIRVDTPCLQVLLAAGRDVEADGRTFSLCNPSDQLRSAFEDIGMSAELDRWRQT